MNKRNARQSNSTATAATTTSKLSRLTAISQTSTPPKRANGQPAKKSAAGEENANQQNSPITNKSTTEAEPKTPIQAGASKRKQRSAEENAMTVEAYLTKECDKAVDQVLQHAEKRIEAFQREAKRVRSEVAAILDE